MISHPLWRFKLISGYISSLLQDFCVYRSRPKTDRSVRSNLIHGPTNGPIDRSGPIPSQKSSVLCIGLDRGPDRTEVVHPWNRRQQVTKMVIDILPLVFGDNKSWSREWADIKAKMKKTSLGKRGREEDQNVEQGPSERVRPSKHKGKGTEDISHTERTS